MYVPVFPEVRAENRAKFIDLMKLVKIPELMLFDVLSLVDDTDFYEAPASTRFHGAYPGGLFDHSLAVTDELVRWTKMEAIDWERPFSPYLVGFLHDFCKVGKYKPILEDEGETDPESGIKAPDLYGFEYEPRTWGFGGHGEDSVCKILLKVPLNTEEAMCIRWHMGAYEKDKWDDFDAAVRNFPNVLWTHHADMIASKIVGV